MPGRGLSACVDEMYEMVGIYSRNVSFLAFSHERKKEERGDDADPFREMNPCSK